MTAKRRTRRKPEAVAGPPDLLQVIAVYQVDLMAELEGLMRTLTRMQQQLERLRSGGESGPLSDGQRREAVKLLAPNVRTFHAKIDTLRDTVPEIETAIQQLDDALPRSGEPAAP